MNLSILQTEIKTMSSKDLLEIVNQARQSAGENLVRLNDFNERIADELDGEDYGKNVVQNFNGTFSSNFELSIEQCTLVSMRESKAVRRNVLQKLKELENQVAKPTLPDFTNPVTAARAWADEVEQKQALQITLQQAQPKINHYDKVADRKNMVNATKVANKLKLSAVALNRHLDELGVYNQTVKRGGRTFNLWFIQKGYGEMVQGEQGYDQPLFTHKGEAWVIEQLISEGVA